MIEECVICLEDIEGNGSLGHIKECGHYYHYHCILQWSEKCNSCPTCRIRFNWIIIKNGRKVQETVVKDTVYVDQFGVEVSQLENLLNGVTIGSTECAVCTMFEQGDTDWEDGCFVCSVCSACLHPQCLGVNGDEGVKFCPMCGESQLVQRERNVRERRERYA